MEHNPTDNESRFAAILRETHPQVRAYVAGLGIPLADVDDIAQEAYVAYYRKIASLPEDLLPIRWLKRTARNHAMNYFRRATRAAARRQALAGLMDPDENQAPDPVADERSLRALRECLERLTSRNRTLVSLRYEENLTSVEAATRTDMTAGAIRIALLRIRQSLRDCVVAKLQRTDA